ncbi:MAG: DMT family transporter [Chloroflexi bacterium]|nr:MAG: DMT family transporter [Chloroflexota bacterium]
MAGRRSGRLLRVRPARLPPCRRTGRSGARDGPAEPAGRFRGDRRLDHLAGATERPGAAGASTCNRGRDPDLRRIRARAVRPESAAGVAFGLIAAISYGAFLLVIRQGNRSGERSFGTLLDASAMTVLVGLIAGFIVGDLDLRPTLPAHGWLLLLAITSQVAGYGFINISLPRLPAVLTSVLLLAQPVATVILSAILLGESPSPGQLLGVAALLSGLAVASVPLGRVRDRLRTATE